MALIYCPGCGKQVSEYAEVCPNCGYLIKTNLNDYISDENVQKNSGTTSSQQKTIPPLSDKKDDLGVYASANVSPTSDESNKKADSLKYWVAIGILIITSIVSVAYGIITYSSVEQQKNDLRRSISEIETQNMKLEKRDQELEAEEANETIKFNALMKEYFTYKRYH